MVLTRKELKKIIKEAILAEQREGLRQQIEENIAKLDQVGQFLKLAYGENDPDILKAMNVLKTKVKEAAEQL